MNTATAERRCTICRDVLSASNTTDHCRRHDFEKGKRPLFRIIDKPNRAAKESTKIKWSASRELTTLVPEIDHPLVSPEEILEIVAQTYEVSREEILGTRRQQRLVWSRQVTMYLLRTGLEMSLPKIASFLNRDHTTVMHGCEQVAQKIKEHPVLAKEVEIIRGKIAV